MRFVVFVAASLASLVAGDEALACPAPPVCDYSAYEVKVKELRHEREACLKGKAAEVADKEALLASNTAAHAKQLAKAEAEVEQFRKSLEEYKKQSVNLGNQVTALQSQVARAQEADVIGRQLANLEKTHKDLIHKSASDIAAANNALDALRSQNGEKIAACEASQSALKQKYESYQREAKTYETKYATLAEQSTQIQEQMESLRKRVEPLMTSVYSKSHVDIARSHVTRIALAFGNFFQKRFTNLVGPDFVKLVKLQSTVWSRRAQAKAVELGTPIFVKAQQLYADKLEVHCAPIINQALEFKDKQSVVVIETIKDLVAKFLVLLERSMDRMVRNLSTVDPTIGEVFGHDFTDRCYAFAFVLICAYIASAIFSWVFNTFIGTPFCWMFGIGKKSKKSRKSTSKSGKADVSKGKNSTVRTSPTKESGKVDAKGGVAKPGAVKTDNAKVTDKADVKKTPGSGDTKATTQKKGVKG